MGSAAYVGSSCSVHAVERRHRKAVDQRTATANPFGTGTVYTSTEGAAVVGNKKAGVSDRLRIVSNTGTTLQFKASDDRSAAP